MEIPDFGFRLFGYSINEVNGELLRADYEHFESLKDLELKIGKYLSENQRLKEEISALKRKRDGGSLQTKFLEAAINEAEQFVKLYEAHSSLEMSRLKEREERMLKLYDDKLRAIEEEIRSAQRVLENAVEIIMSGKDAAPQSAETDVISPRGGSGIPDDIPSSGNESAGTWSVAPSPVKAQSSSVKEDVFTSQCGTNEGADKAIIPFELVRTVKSRGEDVPSKASEEKGASAGEASLADVGTPSPAFTKHNVSSDLTTDFWGAIPKIDYISYDTCDKAEDSSADFPADPQPLSGEGSGQSNDIAEPLPPSELTRDNAEGRDSREASETSAAAVDGESCEVPELHDLIPLRDLDTPPAGGADGAGVSVPGPVSPIASLDAAGESGFDGNSTAPAISESATAPARRDIPPDAPDHEIPAPASSGRDSNSPPKDAPKDKLSLAGKYIVGKIAGEDLYDSAGRLIAAKGAKITEDIVRDADKASKLSELIINMTISDLPEISA